MSRDTADELYDAADDLASPDMILMWPVIVGRVALRLRVLAKHVRAVEAFADETTELARAAEEAVACDNLIRFPRKLRSVV